MDLPPPPLGGSPAGDRSSYRQQQQQQQLLEDIIVAVRKRLTFDIAVSDVPRAARILIKLWGFKRKAKIDSSGGSSSSGNGSVGSGTWGVHSSGIADAVAAGGVFLGWTASTIFDFKGCVDCMQDLRFFAPEAGPVEVPINTTLNNALDPFAAHVGIVLAPDLVLVDNSATPRVRIVHSMPQRAEPLEGDASGEAALLASEGHGGAQAKELDRILQLSFNPLSASMLTSTDKAFLWDLRFALLNRAELLPAFVMSVDWSRSEQVRTALTEYLSHGCFLLALTVSLFHYISSVCLSVSFRPSPLSPPLPSAHNNRYRSCMT